MDLSLSRVKKNVKDRDVDTKLKHPKIFKWSHGFMFLECTVGRDHNHMAHEYLALQIMPVGSMGMEVIISF